MRSEGRKASGRSVRPMSIRKIESIQSRTMSALFTPRIWLSALRVTVALALARVAVVALIAIVPFLMTIIGSATARTHAISAKAVISTTEETHK
jgi:hypothetical protein